MNDIHASTLARNGCLLFLLLIISPALFAQRYNISYAPNSQEGLLLQLIEQLEGVSKLQQMDSFLQRFPNHPSVPWILAFQQDYYAKEGDAGKALAAGERLFLLNPDDLETAVLNQKMAEQKGDPQKVEKWGQAATAAAQKFLAAPKPFYIAAAEWDKRLQYAGGLVAKAEYDIYKRGVDALRPEERIRIFDELLTKNPKSFYAVQALPHQMRAYRALGNNVKALEIGERMLAKDAENEEALIVVGQIWLDRRSNYGRVAAIANRLLSLGQASRKDGYIQEDWDKRRGFFIGAAHQLLGTAHVFQNNFLDGDKSFKAALPYLKGDPQAEASALFYIGWCNYYLENYKEAAAYFKACIRIPGPFQRQATKQLDGMKRERRIVEN